MSNLTARGQRALLRKLIEDDLTLHLFWNVVSDADMARGDVAVFEEVTGFGYAPQVISKDAWAVSVDAVDLREQVFLFDGPLPRSVRGFFVQKNGTLIFSDTLPSPRSIDMAGDSIGVTVRMKLTGHVEPTHMA